MSCSACCVLLWWHQLPGLYHINLERLCAGQAWTAHASSPGQQQQQAPWRDTVICHQYCHQLGPDHLSKALSLTPTNYGPHTEKDNFSMACSLLNKASAATCYEIKGHLAGWSYRVAACCTSAAQLQPAMCAVHAAHHTPCRGVCASPSKCCCWPAHAMVHGGVQPQAVVANLAAKPYAVGQLAETYAAPLQKEVHHSRTHDTAISDDSNASCTMSDSTWCCRQQRSCVLTCSAKPQGPRGGYCACSCGRVC